MAMATNDPAPTRRRRLARPSPERLAGWLAAAFGALMVVLAMPTADLGLPIVLALPPVLVLARTRRWRARLALGWLMGFLFQVVLFRWIPFTVTEMTPVPLPVTWLMWWLYAAWHGLQLGVFLALAEPARRAAERVAPALAGLAVALVYVAVEHLWPTLFPWSFGHAFWRVGPVIALAALGGVPLVTLFVVLLQTALADAWTGRVASARAAAVAALVLVGGGLAWYVHAREATPERTLRVAVVQPNFTLAEKKKANVAQRKKLLARLDAMVRALPAGRYDLIVASEGAFPMYWRVDAEAAATGRDALALPVVSTLQIARAVAEGPRADAILGGLRQGIGGPDDPAPGSGEEPRTHNAAVHIDARGHIRGHYDKRVLVPFSEYLPLSDVFPSLREAIPGIGHFTPGRALCRFDVAGVKVACGICYETMFEDETRAAAQDDARLLLNLTIDTWFGKTVAPEMHLMAHASRAVELGVPLVRAALTGISALVLPTGEVAASLPIDAQDVLSLEVPIVDLAPPFRTTGPVVPWVAVGALAALLVLAARWRRELFPPAGVGPSRQACSRSPAVSPSTVSPETPQSPPPGSPGA